MEVWDLGEDEGGVSTGYWGGQGELEGQNESWYLIFLFQKLDQVEKAAIAPMSVEDLQGAFILILIGWIISAGAFLVEMLILLFK